MTMAEAMFTLGILVALSSSLAFAVRFSANEREQERSAMQLALRRRQLAA